MGLIASRFGVDPAVRRILTRSALAAFGAPTLAAMLAMGGTNAACAQEAAPATQPARTASEAAASEQLAAPETVVVSGSRIVRDGYNSPTPVSVVGIEVLQGNATSNIADALNTLPNFAGSATPQTSAVTVTSGQQAINGLNIGGLGATRTLVLVNGQRTVGSVLTGVVDVSELPQQLISRVDVVTGGASAGYGSDALTGIVNFV
jgi:outer membrane receptor for ferrienterochelin and colicin